MPHYQTTNEQRNIIPLFPLAPSSHRPGMTKKPKKW